MRRSVGMLILGTEIAILSWWFLNLRFETGVDALQYHRMANAIVSDGWAPWVLNPLSYIGAYPGSDTSGVPFLAASLSIMTGGPMDVSILAYDGILLGIFGLGLFMLTVRLTGRIDLGWFAILMGSLAFGIFTALSWSLDERSFNVALTPIFLLLILPREREVTAQRSASRYVALGLTSTVMFVSHLSFLLLVPFVVLVPLLYDVVRRQFAFRRKRKASALYFGAVGISPLLLLTALYQLGILTDLGLQYQLGSSALFSGSSPVIFLLNAIVFVATRVGPVNAACAAIGLLYLVSRPYLPLERITLGGLLLAGFLGLPIVLYSKDLLTPIFVVLGVVGLGALIRPSGRRRVLVLLVSAALVASGSIAFDAWNLARTSKSYRAVYWSPLGVTPESRDGNTWMSGELPSSGCVYGNNGLALQLVTTDPRESVCSGIAVDFMINTDASGAITRPPFRVLFAGFSEINPSSWFTSPDLDRMTQDFAALPTLTVAAAQPLLLRYNVRLIVVDLQKSDQVPRYAFEGTQASPFFADLWSNSYPLYRTETYAVFQIA